METLWAVIVWAVFGIVIGALARLLVPGRQAMGILATMILGIIGSFVGGFLGSLLFSGEFTLSNPAGWIGSLIGAIIVLLIYVNVVAKKRV